MKKNLLFMLFLALTLTCQAQTEVKINPLGLLFSSPDLSAEFAVSENLGIEPSIGISFLNLTVDNSGFTSNGLSYGVNGKYYFNPEKGIDKFYSGIYVRGGSSKYTGKGTNSNSSFSRSFAALGLSFGYKWVSKQNIVFDLGLGIGRKLSDKFTNESSASVNTKSIPILNIDGFLRFGVGYRFGGGSSETTKKRK
jgi:hypothetical protein